MDCITVKRVGKNAGWSFWIGLAPFEHWLCWYMMKLVYEKNNGVLFHSSWIFLPPSTAISSAVLFHYAGNPSGLKSDVQGSTTRPYQSACFDGVCTKLIAPDSYPFITKDYFGATNTLWGRWPACHLFIKVASQSAASAFLAPPTSQPSISTQNKTESRKIQPRIFAGISIRHDLIIDFDYGKHGIYQECWSATTDPILRLIPGLFSP